MNTTTRAAAMHLIDFESVSLEELVSEAELLTRTDRKYIVPMPVAERVICTLDPRTRGLEIAGQRVFSYDSVYFDTPDHSAYRLTAQRRRRRFKVRTRTYLDTGGCFFEVKTKDGRGSTVKTRMPYAVNDRMHLTAAAQEFAAARLTEHGHDRQLIAELEPTMVSRYRRSTLLLPCGSRATIDTDLRWREIDGTDVRLDGRVIFETKSAGRISGLDRALWAEGYRPSGISKFGIGTAALSPTLGRNKWARVFSGAMGLTHD